MSRYSSADRENGSWFLFFLLFILLYLLSDGRDTEHRLTEDDLFTCLPVAEDAGGIKIFTISYGEDADKAVLEKIAEATNGKRYSGDPEIIAEIYERIAFEQ